MKLTSENKYDSRYTGVDWNIVDAAQTISLSTLFFFGRSDRRYSLLYIITSIHKSYVRVTFIATEDGRWRAYLTHAEILGESPQ